MAIPMSSCLKPSSPPSPPPPPSPSPLTSKTTLTPRPTSKEVMSWRSRCVATAACVIIGSSTAGFAAAAGGAIFAAGDHDMKVMEVSEGKVMRWSDRGKCPPWHVSSLEKIVPENLPRPPTGPRSDGFVAHKNAPKVGEFSVKYRSSCYSL